MPTDPIIRRMKTEDLHEVVRIHIEAFPGFFLTQMGCRFLVAYYQAVLEFRDSVALVAERDSRVELAGFAVGFIDPKGFYAFFSARRRRLLPFMLLAAARSPSLIAKILRNTRRVSTQAGSFSEAAELSSIAVDGSGRGTGGALLKAFLSAVASRGARRVTLTTDAENNTKTQLFYERHGFVLEGHERRGNRLLCRYSKILASLA